MSRCTLIGILDDGWSGLSDAAREHLNDASVVIGAGRTLELVRPHLRSETVCHDMDGALATVPHWAKAALAEGRSVAILITPAATARPRACAADLGGRPLPCRRRAPWPATPLPPRR